MFKDKDGFEYEESEEHLAMQSVLIQIDEVIKNSREDTIKEINEIYGGK